MSRRSTAAALLTGLAALVAATAAFSAGSHDSRPAGSFAFGGGRIGPGCLSGGLCFGRPRDLGFDAHARGNGRGVYGTLFYGSNDGLSAGPGIRAEVHCLAVDGNRAAIGGLIPATGDGFVIYVVDNGLPSTPTRDEASLMLVDPPDAPSWPEGFPSVCPTPDANPVGTAPLHAGDLSVEVKSGRAHFPNLLQTCHGRLTAEA